MFSHPLRDNSCINRNPNGEDPRLHAADHGDSLHAEELMARILIFYGTTDGHTAKIAQALAGTLRSRGNDVDVIEAGTADPSPDGYTGIVVAASLHGGRHQRNVQRWARAHATALGRKPTALVTVCLGILQKDASVQQDLAAIVDRFCTTSGWRPTITKTVVGALLYTHYGWLKRWIMKRIVQKAGGDVDTSRDYEYTDWTDLQSFGEQFDRLVTEGTTENATPGSLTNVRVA
jgi:menaquinone-dependent protoporphyrinogen oxidase